MTECYRTELCRPKWAGKFSWPLWRQSVSTQV